MNPDYNTLLRFYKAATGSGYQQNMPIPAPQPQQNILPPQTVIQVNGKASIDALKMSPNSSVLLMDSNEPIVWLCTSDGIGNVTPVPYDITPHKDVPPVDVGNLESRVANIETILTNLFGGVKDGKSDVTTVEPRENEVTDGELDKH